MTAMRTIHVVVNTHGGVGAADWRDDRKDLPTYDEHDKHYIVSCPADTTAEQITNAMDAFLGGYDLPESWTSVPVKAGKRMCLYVDETMATANGYIPAVVYEDESGYYPLTGNGAHASPWYFGKSIEVARNLVNEYNERLGLSRKDAHDIVLSSMLASS